MSTAMRFPLLEDRAQALAADRPNPPLGDGARVQRQTQRSIAAWAACVMLAWLAGHALVLWS